MRRRRPIARGKNFRLAKDGSMPSWQSVQWRGRFRNSCAMALKLDFIMMPIQIIDLAGQHRLQAAKWQKHQRISRDAQG